MYFKLNFILG